MAGSGSPSLTIAREAKPSRSSLAGLMLEKLAEYSSMLRVDFWAHRLQMAEQALDLSFDTGRQYGDEFYDSPVPTHDELTLWRSFAYEAFKQLSWLSQHLTADPKWVNEWPEIVNEAEALRSQAFSVLASVDRLLVSLQFVTAIRRIRNHAPPSVREFHNYKIRTIQ